MRTYEHTYILYTFWILYKLYWSHVLHVLYISHTTYYCTYCTYMRYCVHQLSQSVNRLTTDLILLVWLRLVSRTITCAATSASSYWAAFPLWVGQVHGQSFSNHCNECTNTDTSCLRACLSSNVRSTIFEGVLLGAAQSWGLTGPQLRASATVLAFERLSLASQERIL